MQQQKRKFTQKVIMTCSQEQYDKDLKEGLLSMGYKEYSMERGDDGEYSDLSVNRIDDEGGYINFINKDIFSLDYVESLVFSEYNPDLYLALAAISEGDDPYLGEWFICLQDDPDETGYHSKKGDFFRIEGTSAIDWHVISGYNPKFYRKATVDELFSHFTSGTPEESTESAEESEGVKLKVGDTVRIQKDSEYYEEDNDYNPRDINGVIMHLDDSTDKFQATVQWSNGKKNTYSLGDLILIAREEVVLEKEEEFTIPKNWAVEVTKENEYLLNEWRDVMKPTLATNFKLSSGDFLNPDYPDGSMFTTFGPEYPPFGATVISFEQFKKYVLEGKVIGSIVEPVNEWVPEHGELCEFSDSGSGWKQAYFVGLNPLTISEHKFVGITDEDYSGRWKHVRQILPEVKVSKADIAKMMNCEERQIVIED